jgi:hypothetical protein
MLRNTITTIATPGSGSEFRTGASGVKVGDGPMRCQCTPCYWERYRCVGSTIRGAAGIMRPLQINQRRHRSFRLPRMRELPTRSNVAMVRMRSKPARWGSVVP